MFDKLIYIVSQKRRFIEDTALSLLATAIPLLLLQFLFLPKINSIVGEDAYGLIVTLLGFLALLSSTLFGTLNNVRLLVENIYRQENLSGDFNILQSFFGVLGSVCVFIIYVVYVPSFDILFFLYLILVFILMGAEEYYSVGFRLQLNYRRILMQKVLLSIGYAVGYILFFWGGQWIFVYIFGYLFAVIYLFVKTRLLQEPWIITKLWKVTINHEAVLVISALINNVFVYVDKMILYPIYGGIITTTYYVSTLLGKGISLATFPIAGVLLSHFSQKTNLGKHTVKSMIIFGWIAGLAGYAVCLMISRPLLGYLYPSVIDEAMKYVPVTLAGAVIGVQNTMISPVVLKFCRIQRQIAISIVNLIGYIFISMIFLKLWGLMGFCVGMGMTQLLKYIVYLYVYKLDNEADGT